MIEVTKEMVREIYSRIDSHNHGDGGISEGLAVILADAEQRLRAQIAYQIRAELVCCDVYQLTHNLPMGPRVGEGPHAICYWGEASARIAEDVTQATDIGERPLNQPLLCDKEDGMVAKPKRRLRACVENWPEAETGMYDPRCCRWPKSCSATVYHEEYVTDDDLEPEP